MTGGKNITKQAFVSLYFNIYSNEIMQKPISKAELAGS
jgi:hypothetical protein